MAEVVQALKDDGLTDEHIANKMYFDVDYFRQRVPRFVPPTKLHYRRVCAVYAVYGKLKDMKTGLPLFNANSWKHANNVLKEILAGNTADPPGMVFYHQALDKNGEPRFDEHGMELIVRNRGTNDAECVHKQIITTYGSWSTGPEVFDCMLSVFRHRYNHNVAARRRPGFPTLGHYDTHLIDELQLLVEQNHNKLLYPHWSNSFDLARTDETFNTVRLHSDSLHEELQWLKLSPGIKFS